MKVHEEKRAFPVINGRYGRLTVFPNDVGAATKSLYTYGEWAENEISFLHRFISSGSTVLDVGAYIGTHTLAFARFVGPKGRVIAFEAQPQTFELLQKNVVSNLATEFSTGSSDAVQLEHAIVSDEVGLIAIPTVDLDHEASFGSSSLVGALTETFDKGAALLNATQGQALVRTISVDTLDLKHCALIKVDVEGVEDLVLRGAVHTLKRCQPVVYCECNTLAGGLKTIAVLESVQYVTFAHVVKAFNSENFFGVKEDIFEGACEVALLGVPNLLARQVKLPSARPSELLFEINTADDLALALLNKPQYQREVLRPSRAAKAGGAEVLDHLDASKLELERIRNENSALQKLRAEEQQLLESRLQSALERDRQRDEEIRHLQATAHELGQESAQVHALLTQRDLDIALQQAEASERNRELADLRLLITKLNAEVDDLKASIATMDAKLIERDAHISELVGQCTENDRTLADLHASQSWKLTKPLRWLGRQFSERDPEVRKR